MKIDDLRTSYILPGHPADIDQSANEPEGDEDLEPSLFDRLHGLEMPEPGNWKQVLGLTHATPSLTQIQPPPLPAAQRKTRLAHDDAHWRSFLSTSALYPRLIDKSDPVQNMIHLLAQYQNAKDLIRAKALTGGRE